MKSCLIVMTVALAGFAGAASAGTCGGGGHAKAGIHHGIGLHLGHAGGGGVGGAGMGCAAARSGATAHVHKAR